MARYIDRKREFRFVTGAKLHATSIYPGITRIQGLGRSWVNRRGRKSYEYSFRKVEIFTFDIHSTVKSLLNPQLVDPSFSFLTDSCSI